jgi:DNA-binding HxlR family transcriptional regulator
MTLQENLKDQEVEELLSLCPSYMRATELFSKRWVGLILMVLLKGPKRFNEILANIPGLSDPLLTQRLRELEAEGMVERRVLATSPVRVEYELTEMGQDYQKVAREISIWGHKWLDKDQSKLCS